MDANLVQCVVYLWILQQCSSSNSSNPLDVYTHTTTTGASLGGGGVIPGGGALPGPGKFVLVPDKQRMYESLNQYSSNPLDMYTHTTTTGASLDRGGVSPGGGALPGPGEFVLVPDEQRLYESLMDGYEKSVRPVLNSSAILLVKFALHLNQIIGLDERHQVLTTNVFIDQQWRDENLFWEPDEYNNIRSIRIPASNVWLPDTFIYNNADGGSTGFMQGTYVLVNYNGTVLWPVPVKLKSSCKVDITYFPFDDQMCFLRFGSWIYSGHWMDYQTMDDERAIELSSYVNNSEWDLLSVNLQKNTRTHSCCLDPYPDLTYTLHVRRKTFYYIFNIIVPCIMLSILTLLTFWLPPTSGEKITLGLSVFLAFSMFMLLIAEEVPATSEAVPLIGIYLCVVMTLTSLSVIMAVMVINLYNRGAKTRRAPGWVRVLVLSWISTILRMRHDLERVVETISLENETELENRHGSFRNRRGTSIRKTRETALSSIQEYAYNKQNTVRRRPPSGSEVDPEENTPIATVSKEATPEPESEVIWLRRDEVYPETSQPINVSFEMQENSNANNSNHTADRNHVPSIPRGGKELHHRARSRVIQSRPTPPRDGVNKPSTSGDSSKKSELYYRKLIVAEWQRVAAVIDRVLFWLYFVGTIVAYIVILIIVPKENYAKWNAKLGNTPYIRSESRYTM